MPISIGVLIFINLPERRDGKKREKDKEEKCEKRYSLHRPSPSKQIWDYPWELTISFGRGWSWPNGKIRLAHRVDSEPDIRI